jgi:hypothetical protein
MQNIGKAIGTLLCLAGLGFAGLLVWVRSSGLLAGDIKVPAVMVGCAGLLLWIGSAWLLPKRQSAAQPPLEPTEPALTRLLLKGRYSVEILAAAGSVLMLCHAVALLLNLDELPRWLFSYVVLAPVVVAWFINRLSAGDQMPSRPFRQSAFARRSRTARMLVHVLMRVGWFGYLAMLLYWFRTDVLLTGRWALTVRVAFSLLISLLYASQVLVLDFGNVRQEMSAHKNED